MAAGGIRQLTAPDGSHLHSDLRHAEIQSAASTDDNATLDAILGLTGADGVPTLVDCLDSISELPVSR